MNSGKINHHFRLKIKNAQLRVSLLDTQHHASDDEGNASPTGNLY
jgi:hypothetical protein